MTLVFAIIGVVATAAILGWAWNKKDKK